MERDDLIPCRELRDVFADYTEAALHAHVYPDLHIILNRVHPETVRPCVMADINLRRNGN